ncbi:hypothetical protein [Xiamenia xianingshaonis]|uniref:hypothetical protein n=1 Tax=Xiamenia xianingshaonis TaxID=2682776 RepID=UPI0013EAD191|nr:hypothetical protein [Xiamenia xianingshaonis]
MTASLTSNKLSTLLAVAIVPSVLEACGATKPNEIHAFYQSKLYDLLSRDETGLWHLSPALLAEMYRSECETGRFETPEEQS